MERLTRPWSARTLRLSLFLQSPSEIMDADTWEQATGQTPEIDQNQPRQQMRVQAGSIGTGYLQLQFQGLAQRLDWVMGPTTDAVEFGPVMDALSTFNDVVRKWLVGTQLKSKRLAIGILAVIPAPDRIAAYTALRDFLPSVKIDAEHSRDLTYSINRPKPSRSLGQEVELNRLTRWGVLQIQTLTISNPSAIVPALVGGMHVFVECDNSTPAEQETPLDNASFADIYDELIEMALQNLERGELP
jgi:hypothetical protein